MHVDTTLRTIPPPKNKHTHTHRLRANRQREAARRRQQTPEQLADNQQRRATRRQQETTQAREARCVCIRPWVCVSVYMYPSCARWLVAKKFGCKRAHINEYDNNTHKAGQSVPASRGADGRNRITRLTTTYEHSECIQTRRLGLPPPKHTHRLRAKRQREAARRRQQTPEQLAVDRQRHATRRQQETTQAREARCVYPSLGMCIRVCVYPSCARWLVAKKFGCKRAHINYYDNNTHEACLLYTSPSPRDLSTSRMPSSA